METNAMEAHAMEWNRILLDGQWTMGVLPHEEVVRQGIAWTRLQDILEGGALVVPAAVPGNFELDLHRAGHLPDPFVGMNILALQELENRHTWYGRTFDFHGDAARTRLVFEGIDTFAEIYLNGDLVATTDNMLIPHEIDVPGLRDGANELVVHILPTNIVTRSMPLEAGCFAMKYSWEALRARKAPHMYGWDIMPRAVSAGIWRSVWLETRPVDRIDDVFLYTANVNAAARTATLCLFYQANLDLDNARRYRIRVRGQAGDAAFEGEAPLWHSTGKLTLYVGGARFWWPRPSGEPVLYDVTVELLRDGDPVDVRYMRTGIRTVALERTSVTDSTGSGQFRILVNGEPVFIKGTNWVPVDAFHSRDRARLPQALDLLGDIGCNAVRCWGGNVYEDDLFYDFCDQAGILVWQDFSMACAVYPQDEAFGQAMAREVAAIVRRLRNHPCIALWAGDNECDYAFAFWDGLHRNPNDNVLTRKVVPETLRLWDLTRPYLPSSPYIDDTAYRLGACSLDGAGKSLLPEDHLWGPRDYFKSRFYAGSSAHFASEMGYHGCPSPVSLRKFLSPDRVWPCQDNEEWIVHAASPEPGPDAPWAYRIDLMARQVRELFGFIPEDLDTFAYASQVSQAEAFKFFIEMFRSAKWRRTGIIWWNLLDGWPQISDAVVYLY